MDLAFLVHSKCIFVYPMIINAFSVLELLVLAVFNRGLQKLTSGTLLDHCRCPTNTIKTIYYIYYYVTSSALYARYGHRQSAVQ